MTFVSWNINGIRAIDRKGALRWIDEADIDFLALQEIKAQAQEVPTTLFSRRYPFCAINSASQKGYSGVALYSAIKGEAFACEEVDTLEEGRIVEYHFKGVYVLLNIYFPNGQRDASRFAYKMAFYERLLAYIVKLKASGKVVIICGDFNTAHLDVDVADLSEAKGRSGFLDVERAWIGRLIDAGFIDTFRLIHPEAKERYSWWSYTKGARQRNRGWRIDYFFVCDSFKRGYCRSRYFRGDRRLRPRPC